jgi:hypothetical protein
VQLPIFGLREQLLQQVGKTVVCYLVAGHQSLLVAVYEMLRLEPLRLAPLEVNGNMFFGVLYNRLSDD